MGCICASMHILFNNMCYFYRIAKHLNPKIPNFVNKQAGIVAALAFMLHKFFGLRCSGCAKSA